ncbi:MAG: GNAT family N-acetyltransferase [Desulfobacterales bacterium]|nr:GNAT family N-acetyltransferase [Desulfobacterales bacterium]
MSIRGLSKLFFPSALAVLGIDEGTENPGRRVLANIVAGGYQGAVYPISKNVGQVNGLPVYANLAAVKKPIDLAILSLAPEYIPTAIEACGQAGVSGVLIPSLKATPEEAIAPIREQARKTGVRVIGPHAWGICSPWTSLNAGFGRQLPPAGELAVISQSNAICSNLLDLSISRHIGLSLLVDLGDMVEVDCADLLDYSATHFRVGAILLYVEHIGDMRKFMSAARSAARLKPVVVLKSGRCSSISQTTKTPSGKLIDEDIVYDAAFARAGIVRVATVEQLFDCGDLLSKHPRPRGSGLSIVSNARGPAVMAVDALQKHGLKPLPLSSEILAALAPLVETSADRPHTALTLPADIPARPLGQLVSRCLDAKEVQTLLVILVPRFLTDPDAVARAITGAADKKSAPLIAVWMGENGCENGRRILCEAGIPTYDVPERAVEAFLNLTTYAHNIQQLQEIPPRLSGRFATHRARAQAVMRIALQTNDCVLEGRRALMFLQAYDIPADCFPAVHAWGTAEESELLSATNCPASASADDGSSMATVKVPEGRESADETAISPESRQADATICLVSRQLPPFGPVILFGTGSLPPELSTDFAVGLPPLNRLLARQLMERTMLYRFLCTKSPSAVPFLEELLVNFSHLVTDLPEILELEINPLAVCGSQARACNARIFIQPSDKRSPLHLVISPYPDEYEVNTVTSGGISLFLRPIKPEDAPLLQELWSELSPRTLYYRFAKPVTDLTPALLARFTQIDYDREIALVALQPSAAGQRMLGVARLISAPGSDTVEFAIIVGDPWQGQGVGAELLRRLAVIAVRRGFKTLWGLVLRENRAMIDLAHKLRWPAFSDADFSEVEVRLDLTTVKESEILEATGGKSRF